MEPSNATLVSSPIEWVDRCPAAAPFALRSIAWGIAGPPGGLLELPSDKDRKTSSKKSPAKVQSKDRDMGAALRSAYQRTVDESVPDEMLDLLNKLA
ncbi:MAG: NepR family anti-sigma factor [Sphingomonas taxi]